MHSLQIVQWDSTRRDHPGNPRGVSRSGPVTFNGKNKHIRLRHEVVKQLLKDGIISIDYVKSEVNLADPLTKPLRIKLILETSSRMGLKPI